MSPIARAYALALTAVACWSTVATAFKLGLRYVTPAQLLMLGALSATGFLITTLAVHGRIGELLRQSRSQYLRSALLGALNPALYYLILFQAYKLLPAQQAQPINYTWALVLSLLSVPLLGHRLRWSDLLAGLVCYLGVMIIATGGNLAAMQFESLPGVLLALLSTVIWALYWLLNERQRIDSLLGVTLNFCWASLFILIWCALRGEFGTLAWPGLASGLWVGLFEMGLPFLCWAGAMRLTDNASRIANLIFISPFVSLLFIALILGETIRPATVWGLLLIVAGLLYQKHQAAPTAASLRS